MLIKLVTFLYPQDNQSLRTTSIQEEVYGSENLVRLFIPLQLVMVLCFSTLIRTHIEYNPILLSPPLPTGSIQ